MTEFKTGQRVKINGRELIGTIRTVKTCGRVVVSLKIPEGNVLKVYNPWEITALFQEQR